MAATSMAPSEKALVPPLKGGDKLDAVEFMRRYEAMPDLKKAELIEGTVYLPSPVRSAHAAPNARIQCWLGWYALQTPGTDAGGDATVRLGPRDVPQPDAALRILPEHGGKTRLDPAGYVVGAPELIVEIAASSAAIDLHGKLRAYCLAGVREYLVWRPLDHQFDWFVLERNEYRSNSPARPGVLVSPHFPGLALAVEALLNDDWVKVRDVLQAEMQTSAHACFVAKLAAKRRK